MALPYQLRLIGLCLAAFFLVHTVLGLIVAAYAGAAVRRAERLPSHWAVRMLLGLRLAPLTLALFTVAVGCVPSYIALEPERDPERVGLAFLAAALCGLALWVVAGCRASRAAAESLRYGRHCRRNGKDTQLPGASLLVLDEDETSPLLFVSGVFHSRMVASRSLLGALSAEQLDAALRHERAHLAARDNLKRLILMLAPGVLPGWRGFGPLERGWARLAEWAADDCAVDGDSERSLSLAGALVRVARMAPRSVPLIAHLLGEQPDLVARVHRLLAPPRSANARGLGMLLPGVCGAAMACAIAALLQPASLYSIHAVIERLIH